MYGTQSTFSFIASATALPPNAGVPRTAPHFPADRSCIQRSLSGGIAHQNTFAMIDSLASKGGQYPCIVAMHRALYDGPHAAELRQDIPYRPHMTIATHADAASSDVAIKEARRLRLPVSARLTAVTLVKRDGERIEHVAEIPLSG